MRILKVIYVVLLVSLLLSCPQDNNSNVDSITLSVVGSNKQNLRDNGVIVLTPRIFNKSGTELIDAPISYSLKGDDNKDYTSSVVVNGRTATINVKNINRLGDYTLTAKSEDKVSFYSFTIDTDKLLSNSLSYSIVSYMDEIMTEYDIFGNKILRESERPSLGNTLTYNPTSYRSIFITLTESDRADFGELDITTSSSSNNIQINRDEKGIIIHCPSIEEDESLTYRVKAGNKQEKSVILNLKKLSDRAESVAQPQFSGVSYSSIAGQYISILGDNITTTYSPIEKGDIVELSVEKKYIGQDDSQYMPYRTYLKTSAIATPPDEWEDEDMASDECALITPTSNGYYVYIKYAGTYKITYNLIDGETGENKGSGSKTIDINLANATGTLTLETPINRSSILADSIELDKDYNGISFKNSRQDIYSVAVNGSVAKPITLYISFTNKDAEALEQDKRFDKEEIITQKRFTLKTAGDYTIAFVHSNIGNGYGNLGKSKREFEYYKEMGVINPQDYTILNADEWNKINYQYLFNEKIENQIDVDGKYYTTYLFDTQSSYFRNYFANSNCDVYVRFYEINGKIGKSITGSLTLNQMGGKIPDRTSYKVMQDTFKLTESSKIGFRFQSSEIKDIRPIIYVFPRAKNKYDSNIMAINIKNITTTFSSNLNLSFEEIPDNEQTIVDEREIILNGANEHTMYYRIGNGSWQTFTGNSKRISVSTTSRIELYGKHTQTGIDTPHITKTVYVDTVDSMTLTRNTNQTKYNSAEYTFTFSTNQSGLYNTIYTVNKYGTKTPLTTFTSTTVSCPFTYESEKEDITQIYIERKGYKSVRKNIVYDKNDKLEYNGAFNMYCYYPDVILVRHDEAIASRDKYYGFINREDVYDIQLVESMIYRDYDRNNDTWRDFSRNILGGATFPVNLPFQTRIECYKHCRILGNPNGYGDNVYVFEIQGKGYKTINFNGRQTLKDMGKDKGHYTSDNDGATRNLDYRKWLDERYCKKDRYLYPMEEIHPYNYYGG